MTPTTLAEEIILGIERINRFYGGNPPQVVRDQIEDFVWGKAVDFERAIRRGCGDERPAYLDHSDSE
jgi:hypothetical protein